MPAYQYSYVIKNLTKTYPGGRTVLKDIWLSFFPGAKIGIIGPNGAGKTTTLRMLAGFLEPDEGAVRALHYDMRRQRVKAQTAIGYLPEGAPLYGEMTPWSYLSFVANARGLSGAKGRAGFTDDRGIAVQSERETEA